MPLARSPPLLARLDKQGLVLESPSPNSSNMSDSAKRSARATPVRTGAMPPRPSTAGDAKGRLPLGGSPSGGASGHPAVQPFHMRDSAELRRQGPASAKDSSKSPGEALGGLDLMLTGKQIPPDHPLLGGASPRAGSDDEASFKLGEEEAQILNKSWQGSPHTDRSSRSMGGEHDATTSPPSSRFASVNASRERECTWSPQARNVTGASVDQSDSRTYDQDEEDTVNQSLNASVISASSSRDERPTMRPSTPPLASMPDDSPASGPRHRGMIAARAMMGRKRVYGAVVIQQWLRKLLQRKAQQERENVKQLLRERREKKDHEEHERRAQEEMLTASLRSEKEESLKETLQQREEEVERATRRLKRNLQASMSFPTAPCAPATPTSARDTSLLFKSSLPNSPQQRASASRGDASSHASPVSVKSAGAAHENDDDKEQEQSLMDALRASVERSADMLGLVRGTASPHAASPHAARSPHTMCSPLSMSAVSAVSSARYGISYEGVFRDDNNHNRAQTAHQQTTHLPSNSPSQHTRSLHKSTASSPAESCTYHTASITSPTATSELIQRREMPALEAVKVPSPHTSQVNSPSLQTADRQRTARYANMDAAAKEVQTSILSFLDSVEAGRNLQNTASSKTAMLHE